MNTNSDTNTISIDLSAHSRRCGGCQLCCRLLPVMSIHKPGNTRCAHQRTSKGCTVYHTLKMPRECHVWSCRWLVDPAASELRRPDRTHYVVDVMPDMIGVQDNATGETRECMVVQVWVDPNYPDAHRDPALRRFLNVIAEAERVPALVRRGVRAGILIVAPCLSTTEAWQEITVQLSAKMENRFVNALASGGAAMNFTEAGA